jgi:hypothetical protein
LPGAELIELKGKTILPGLSDMHVHLGSLVRAKWVLKLLLAHGITTVREVGNSLENITAIRGWLQENKPLPHLYVSGKTMNGSWRNREFLKQGSDLQSELENNMALDVDFLKVHNWVSTLALSQIAEFAEKHDRYLAGHVPLSMTSVSAIDTGMKILEHVRLRPWEVLDDPEIISKYPVDLILMKRTGYWAYFDPQAAALQRTLNAWEKRKDKFYLDPTIVVRWGGAHEEEAETLLGDKLKMVSPAVLEGWRSSIGQYGDLNAVERKGAKATVEAMTKFVGLPGYSLHQELGFLAEAGMTPVEAIHCSTGRAAEVLRIKDIGVLLEGKKANLLIVNGDVAADIGNISKIEQVMLGGKLFDPSQLLKEAAEYAAVDVSGKG